MVLELRGHGPFDRPVPRVVHARRHLVRDQLAAGDEELDGEHAGVAEVVEHPAQVAFGGALQSRIASGRDRDPQDGGVGRVGYEINFNRYFYTYQPPRSLQEIEAEILALQAEIGQLLGGL